MISTSEFSAIAALDLDPIKVKLMHKESGEGWSLAYANEVEFEYRRFLYLMKMYPNENTAPLFDVDIFWHYHILDTMKYARDCEQVFGYFLHHFPYIGLRDEEDEMVRLQAGERMRELYEGTFGESYSRSTDATEQLGTVVDGAVASQAAYCSATGPKTAYCSLTGPKTAYCSLNAAKTAYCSLNSAKTAYCSLNSAKTAYCSLNSAKTAYCSLNAAKTAYCSLNAAKTAYCSLNSAKTAYCSFASDKMSNLGANPSLYTRRPELAVQ